MRWNLCAMLRQLVDRVKSGKFKSDLGDPNIEAADQGFGRRSIEEVKSADRRSEKRNFKFSENFVLCIYFCFE